MTAGAVRPAPRIGRIARWKLTEPLRLYVWPVLALLLAVRVIAAAAVGAWSGLLLVDVPLLLLAVGALEAARRSVYSPAGAVHAVRDAMRQR